MLLWGLRPAPSEPEVIAGDVNGDDIVNILDLTLVASRFGEMGENAADVNGDNVVNIADLVLVAGALGAGGAAPSVWHRDREVTLTRAEVEQWLTQNTGVRPQ